MNRGASLLCVTRTITRGRLLPCQSFSVQSTTPGAPDSSASVPTEAVALYRALFKAVREFPDEPISQLAKGQPTFQEIAWDRIRKEFRENQSVETVQASKLLAAGGKELKALRALVNNEHLAKYPGPQAIDKFFEKKA
mmetsp:Transcript_49152/g.76682  ORF Transcript_49152/g.76682 Transcript_49152/m.76682 type:complete len:138 (+) Transcript_49152:99-512(+)